MDKIQRQREHFNSVAERYKTARQGSNHLYLKALIWEEFLGKHPQLRRPGLKVLEAMCGFADGKKILEETLGIETNYSGFDYSDEVVEQLKQDDPDICVFHADVGQVELEEQYDVIVLLGGLHHVPHIAATAVKRLATALKPGGYFINLEPTSGNPLFTLIRDKIYERNSLFDEETERAFDVKELFGFFGDAGLVGADKMYPGLLSYILYYNPDAFPLLNVGGSRTVKAAFGLDKLFLRNSIGRFFSFATLSMWMRPYN